MNFLDFSSAIDPTLHLDGFHGSYYRVLDAFASGRIRRLIVTIPPQHGKSVAATQLLPAYLLGLDPDLRVAIASYSASLASRFNRRVQRTIESSDYAELFPQTRIKAPSERSSYIRTADEVEIIDHNGALLSVGRDGSLTGNRVDCFILDDLYKNSLEANSAIVRENCWDWYTSVVRTRMHNFSRELIVFTRWHDEDLIGEICRREQVVTLRSWRDIDFLPEGAWAHLNFEAIKCGQPTEIDPRHEGEVLWEEQQNADLLARKRNLDPVQFECMYQGHPCPNEGLLYGDRFEEYDTLPDNIVRWGNYTDTADTGGDYLCSVCYAVDSNGLIYIRDVVYTRAPMEITEPQVAEMLLATATRYADIESNNGGRAFARNVQMLAPRVSVRWFHQSDNKEARILSNSASVIHLIRFPTSWNERWTDFHHHLTTYRRMFDANRYHDAPDALTGIIEHEAFRPAPTQISFLR